MKAKVVYKRLLPHRRGSLFASDPPCNIRKIEGFLIDFKENLKFCLIPLVK